MKKTLFGTIDQCPVYKYTLTNGVMEADILTYGGTITAVRVPDAAGRLTDVVAGWETLEDYQTKGGYLGAIIGRFGNRIENGRFTLNGVTYQVGINEAPNSLHGGVKGFDRQIWEATEAGENTLILNYLSKDGEEGFPGNLNVTVTYTVTAENGLSIDYKAVSDRDTVVNLTNHAYFNVAGPEATTAECILCIDADRITPADSALIPHNTYKDIAGTLYDFRTPSPFVKDLSADETLEKRGCYDENYVLNGEGLRAVAQVYAPKSGICVTVVTDQPGMQIYTGNPRGIALETQNFPNAVNCPDYPSAVLRSGACYHTQTIYQFAIKENVL